MRGLVRRLGAWPAYRWVCLLVVIYFAIALFGTWANFVDLHLSVQRNNIIDLSTNQQALSSTIHSNLPHPFYEAQDCGGSGRCSFLEVHPVFFAYLVAVPYAIWPSALTLFVLQDVALALAALPLFAIARTVTQSNRLSLLVAGAYLAWWPAFTSIFSFHWEAFIPLELFLVFWLWLTHRYWVAVPVILVSYVTLEVMPVLIFLVGVFFLLDWAPLVLKYLWAEVQYFDTKRGPEAAAKMRTELGRVRAALVRPPAVRASLLLLLGSLAAYLTLHAFVTSGGWLLGLPPLPAMYAIPYSRPTFASVFTLANFTTNLSTKVTYWVVIFGTLAAVPLLAPRTLVLSVPWILFSMLAAPGYYLMGTHYIFVTAAVVFIGFLYGVARLGRWADASRPWWRRHPPNDSPSRYSRASSSVPTERSGKAEADVPPPQQPSTPGHRTSSSENPAESESSQSSNPESTGRLAPSASHPPANAQRRPTRRRAHVAIVAGLTLVIAFNLFLNPFNPLSAGLVTDLGQSYSLESTLSLNGFNDSSYLALQELVSMIPGDPVVAVAPALYTFVADDPYAYPLTPTFQDGANLARLPFNVTSSLPQYVVFMTHGVSLPPYLSTTIYDSSLGPYFFGVRAWIPETYLGGIWLLESNYSGPTRVLGSASLSTGGNYTSQNGMVPGPDGKIVRGSTAIEAAPNPNASVRHTGIVFTGPAVTLAAGTYQVTLNVNATLSSRAPKMPQDTPVVTLNFTGEWGGLQPWFQLASIELSSFSTKAPTSVTVTLNLTDPVADFQVAGDNLYPWLGFQENYVSISPVTSE